MGKLPRDAFGLDEEPLRKTILKGYFGEKTAVEPEPLVARLRDLLSGDPGGECDPERYYFELDPELILPDFLRGLEVEQRGLATLIAEPLLSAAEEMAAARRTEIAPNPAVLVSSLAGSIALKAEISEPVAAALLAGFLIALGRLGPSRVRALYAATLAGPPRRSV